MTYHARFETLSPWALRPTISAQIWRPETQYDIPHLLQNSPGGLLVRGAGTAYGDSCVNPEGYHLSTARLNKFISFDATSGRLVCQAGVTLGEIIDVVLPRGWFLKVSPGTMLSTVGGCFACDVHGKNHHIHGSFSSTINEIELVTADGTNQICSPDQNSELFWATAGGLGQTGIITRVTLQLMKVESAWLKVSNIRTKNFEETMTQIDCNPDSTYSVCWLDSLARGKDFGRGVLMLGEHATLQELSASLPGETAKPLADYSRSRISLPFFPPEGLAGTWSWRIFNDIYYHNNGNSSESLMHFRSFFYPLDRVRNWNRIYGRNGFIEYQIAVPLDTGHSICRKVLLALSGTGNGSFLAVIKRFGPGNTSPLSFPFEGYTLAVDMAAGGKDQEEVLAELDRIVANSGGRVYLVKDSRLGPPECFRMYPRIGEWTNLVNSLDPTGIFTSSLVRRLGLR